MGNEWAICFYLQKAQVIYRQAIERAMPVKIPQSAFFNKNGELH